MTKFERFYRWLALLVGIFGVVACATATVVVWSTGSRLRQTNEKVFDGIDNSLAVVRDRVLVAQRHVQESIITTENIRKNVRSWTREEAGERLASRMELEEKAEQVVQGLQQADLWVEMSETSIQSVQQVFEVGSSLGAPLDAASVDPLLEKLKALRSQIKESTETVDGIRERAAKVAEGEELEDGVNQVVQLARRLAATLGEMDVRLGQSAEQLAETQTKGRSLQATTRSYIVTAEVGAVLLIAWMAAGQVSLCRHGWKDARQRQSAA